MWAYKFQHISLRPQPLPIFSYCCLLYTKQFLLSWPYSHTMTTAMSKAMAACLCVMMMLCGLLVEDANASAISPGAMRNDASPGCSPQHPQSCGHTPANPFTRGCEHEVNCRSGGGHRRPKRTWIFFYLLKLIIITFSFTPLNFIK